MATETKTVTVKTNGVDVDALFQNIDALRADPKLAMFRFRQTNRWLDGGHNRSIIKNFYGVGQEQESRPEPYVLDADEPPVLLGTDLGANPVEYLLHAITACVTTALVYHAAAKGIRIESLESRTEGDIDLRGFLGIDPAIRRGYQGIRMTFKIKADVPDDQLEDLVQMGAGFSPVFDSVSNGVPVQVSVER